MFIFFHRVNDSCPLLHTWTHRRSNWTKSVLTRNGRQLYRIRRKTRRRKIRCKRREKNFKANKINKNERRTNNCAADSCLRVFMRIELSRVGRTKRSDASVTDREPFSLFTIIIYRNPINEKPKRCHKHDFIKYSYIRWYSILKIIKVENPPHNFF